MAGHSSQPELRPPRLRFTNAPNRARGSVVNAARLRPGLGHALFSLGVRVNPNAEVEAGLRPATRGAHAAGVSFSAARRKLRTTNFLTWDADKRMSDKGWGGPPQPAREPHALPIPSAEFGFNAGEAKHGSFPIFRKALAK